MVDAEEDVQRGRHPERPYVLFVQQSLFDPTRAPDGAQTAWAYCHVPNGSELDMTDRIEAQVERFAPGFRDRIVARHVMGPGAMQRHDANYVGGDINGGIADLRQFVARPVLSPHAVGDAGRRAVPLLVVDPARRRGARHVRLARGADRAAPRALAAGCAVRRGVAAGRTRPTSRAGPSG